MHWFNFRCRKCGEIISVQMDRDPSCFNSLGIAFDSKGHNCNFHGGLEEGESAYCDMVSFSENPLSYAVDVHYKKED